MAHTYRAIVGTQFGAEYYTVLIPYRDLGLVTKVEVHSQRPPGRGRDKKIADYLIERDDGIFPPVVLAADYGQKLKFRRDGRNETTGELTFDDPLFVLDGQHRISGIRRALGTVAGEMMADWELAAMILPNRPVELRSQHFADMNSLAKPVTKSQRYSRDYRDEAVIYVREVLSRLKLWDYVNKESSYIGKRYRWAFTWLVEATRPLLPPLERTDPVNKVRILTEFWGIVNRTLEPYWGKQQEYLCSSTAVLYLIARLGRNLITADDRDELLSRLDRVDWRRHDGDFEGLLVANGDWIRGASTTNVRLPVLGKVIKAIGAEHHFPDLMAKLAAEQTGETAVDHASD